MKKFIVLLLFAVLLYSTNFIISTSASVPLTDEKVYKDLSKSFTEKLRTAITCKYSAGAWWWNGSSKTICETTSDQFCYVWVRNEDFNGVSVFDSNSGYVSGTIETETIKLQTTKNAKQTWHGAYRAIGSVTGERNLDARREYHDISTKPND